MKSLWRRQWHPTPVLLPGKSHGWRSLVGCSPWGREESDTTERLPFPFSLYALEKEMATHSVFLPGESQGRGEPGGLPSMGSHRVGHDWSDLAAAIPFSKRSSWSRDWTQVSFTAGRFFTVWTTREDQRLPFKFQRVNWLTDPHGMYGRLYSDPCWEQGMIQQVDLEGKVVERVYRREPWASVQTQWFQSIPVLSYRIDDACLISISAPQPPLHPLYPQLLIAWHYFSLLGHTLAPHTWWQRCSCSSFDLGHGQHVRLYLSQQLPHHAPILGASLWHGLVSHKWGLDTLVQKKIFFLGIIEPESLHPRIIMSRIKEMQKVRLKREKNMKNYVNGWWSVLRGKRKPG